MVQQKEIIVSVAIGLSCLYIYSKLFHSTSKELTINKFKRIGKMVQNELPFKLHIINRDAYDLRKLKNININSDEGFKEMISLKMSLVQTCIEEICSFFDVNLHSYIKFFNHFPDNKYIDNMHEPIIRYCKPSFD